jgi:hypothetical protein
MALSLIQQVRLLTQDTAVGFYFTTDEEIQFFLDRNNQNVNRASLEVARVILLQLSMWSANETVDIFSVTGGAKAAAEYRASLEMFIRNPQLNPVYNSVNGYAGGISKADIQANLDNVDNNFIDTPNSELSLNNPDPFGVYNNG